MKRFSLVILLSLLVMAFGSPNAGITLDTVINLRATDTIQCGVTVEFHLRWTNDTGRVTQSTNGFVLHDSGTGAVWTYPLGSDVGGEFSQDIDWSGYYEALRSVNIFPDPLTGGPADTIAFGGATFANPAQGIPAGFDSVFAVIKILVDCADTGKQVCIDSVTNYPPSNVWIWSGSGIGNVFPTWDGPHCFTIGSQGTDIGDPENRLLPTVFALGQNYPNPFNPTTNISFDVPFKSRVKISVYNILGQRVAVPLDREMVAGSHKIEWDAAREGVTSGVYFFKMEAGDFVKTRKMMLLK